MQPPCERHGVIPASCAGGFLTRIPVAALALSRGGGFTLAERVFMAASWVPKVLLWALKFRKFMLLPEKPCTADLSLQHFISVWASRGSPHGQGVAPEGTSVCLRDASMQVNR